MFSVADASFDIHLFRNFCLLEITISKVNPNLAVAVVDNREVYICVVCGIYNVSQ